MKEVLDKNVRIYGKSTVLAFGQNDLIITYKDGSKKVIPLNNIQSIEYKPGKWWRTFIAFIVSLALQGYHDFRSHLEIAYTINGDEALTSCIGKFDTHEIEEMRGFIPEASETL